MLTQNNILFVRLLMLRRFRQKQIASRMALFPVPLGPHMLWRCADNQTVVAPRGHFLLQLTGNPVIPGEASIEWTNSYLVFEAFEALDIHRMDTEKLCLVNHAPCAEGASDLDC
jgi:hypothetical protein